MNSTLSANDSSMMFDASGGCLYVDGALSKFDAFLFVLISVAAIFGNLLVFVCYARYRALRSVTNVFIVSLSASDLIVACVSIPFSYAVFVCGFRPKHDQGKLEDLIYNVCDMIPSMWSIYSLALVAIDRAIAIKKPFFHRKYVTRRTAWMAVTTTWLLAFFFVSMLFFIDRMHFTLFIIIMAFFLPVTIMVISYGIMGYIAKTHAKELSSLERTAQRLRNDSSVSVMHVTGAIAMSHLDVGNGHIKTSICSDDDTMHVNFNQHIDSNSLEPLKSPEPLKGPSHSSKSRSFLSRTVRRLSSSVANSTSFSHTRSLRRELKAAMTLALILGCFIINWTPFIGVNIAYYVCPECPLDPHMVKYFKILHYTNSALNPVLYILLNKRWKAAFTTTICCRYTRAQTSESTQTELFGW